MNTLSSFSGSRNNYQDACPHFSLKKTFAPDKYQDKGMSRPGRLSITLLKRMSEWPVRCLARARQRPIGAGGRQSGPTAAKCTCPAPRRTCTGQNSHSLSVCVGTCKVPLCPLVELILWRTSTCRFAQLSDQSKLNQATAINFSTP